MRILITGARGFLGRSIATAASQRGWNVCGLGRSSQAPEGWPGSYHWGDVAQSDLTPLLQRFEPDVVFHGAGAASVGLSFDAPLDDLRSSVLTLASVLDSVRRMALRPTVMFPSSAAVYGNPTQFPICEIDPTQPISPYGYHKLQCEMLIEEYARCFEVDAITFRIFSLFGEGQRRLLVWELYEKFMSKSQEIALAGTGLESRDYLHVSDAANAMLDIASLPKSNRSRIYNLGSGVDRNVLSICTVLSELLRLKKQIVANPATRHGDPARWQADMALLKSSLKHWHPEPFESGLARTLNAWQGSQPGPTSG
jgi:UDP-glucose 4-epimerase